MPIFNLGEENLRSLNDELVKIKWDSVMGKEDVNECFEEFHNIFTTLYQKHCFKEKPAKRGRKKCTNKAVGY